MPKQKFTYACQECDYESPKWLGKCPRCEAWNSFQELASTCAKSRQTPNVNEATSPQRVNEISEEEVERSRCGIAEFDRVMGGGITKGSLTLLGGEPGIGKTTLLMEVFGKISKDSRKKVLYVSGEESKAQIASRCKRLGMEDGEFLILNETNWQSIQSVLKKIKPDFLVLDSIQTTYSSEAQSAAGTATQVREVTFEVMNYANASGVSCFVIGHVTKEGSIAGPKILEHMVDTVVYFEGDRLGQYRMLRVMKNRFGDTNEVGVFEMSGCGLKEVSDPSQHFLDESEDSSFGRALTCVLEGRRPIFIEAQALVVENKFAQGRRTTQGIDSNRLSMLIAVVDKYFETPLSLNDIYINIAGGMKLDGREGDLAILMSLLSSYYLKEVDNKTLFIGEVGLTGEVRPVAKLEARLKEIERLSYKRVVIGQKGLSNISELKERFNFELIPVDKAIELNSFFKHR